MPAVVLVIAANQCEARDREAQSRSTGRCDDKPERGPPHRGAVPTPGQNERHDFHTVPCAQPQASNSAQGQRGSGITCRSGVGVPLQGRVKAIRGGWRAGPGGRTLGRRGSSISSTSEGAAMSQVIPNPGILLYTRIKKSPYYYGSRRHGVALYSVLQPPLPPAALRRPVPGVLAAARGRDAVGRRRRRAPGRDHGAGRVRVHEHAHAAQPRPVRGRAVQVRVHHRRARRDHQRPRPAAPGREPLLALAGRQRRAAVVQGRGAQLGARRADHTSPMWLPCRSRGRSPRR